MWLGTSSVRKTATIVMTFWFVGLMQAADFSGGTGEADNPYRIVTAEQLMSLGSDPNLLNKRFILVGDIDLDPNLPGGKVFEEAAIAPRPDKTDPRYLENTSFSGVFDGGGHVIRNLTIQGGSYLGLFGQNSGTIRNLGIVDARITGSGDNIGALVGFNSGTLTECRCSGAVAGGSRVGGVVGTVMAGRVIRCRSDVKVAALGESAGGLAGYSAASRILMNCSTGSVCGRRYVGGAVGTNEEGTVVHCYATGGVMGSTCVAGLIGLNRNGSVIQCYSVGLVTGESEVGGLISWNSSAGRTQGVVDGCFWDTENSSQPTSGAGMGRTTAQMHDIETFLAAGWDFVDEAPNGTCGYWWMRPGEYPRLCCHDGVAPVMPEGSGTAEEPYLLRDANDLGAVWFEPQAHYRLESSIDLSGITWSVAVVPWFAGGFDGNGHVIGNLHIEGNSYLGLFGESGPEATIFNLGLETVDVHGSGNHVGALAGYHRGGITASQTTGTVHADGEGVGGLVGTNFGSLATSHSAGGVTGHGRVGGLVGRCDRDGDIRDSYSIASVDGSDIYVGGLVGFHSGSIKGCHNTGMVVGQSYTGGLVGKNVGDIAASYSGSTVSGRQLVGGLAGHNTGDISTSCSTGTVTGDRRVGGLVGLSDGSITASYSTGTVSGNDEVGGLVGCNAYAVVGLNVRGSIIASYSTGFVSGRDFVGGLVGAEGPQGVTGSFWDTETSGQAASVAGTGKTTAEMQAAATFLDAGWDFEGEMINGEADTWWILEGQDYPRLWWERDESRM